MMETAHWREAIPDWPPSARLCTDMPGSPARRRLGPHKHDEGRSVCTYIRNQTRESISQSCTRFLEVPSADLQPVFRDSYWRHLHSFINDIHGFIFALNQSILGISADCDVGQWIIVGKQQKKTHLGPIERSLWVARSLRARTKAPNWRGMRRV